MTGERRSGAVVKAVLAVATLAASAVAAGAAGGAAALASPTATATRWHQVSAGYYHTCAVAQNRALWCWGDNTDGQVGIGSTSDQVNLPAQIG